MFKACVFFNAGGFQKGDVVKIVCLKPGIFGMRVTLHKMVCSFFCWHQEVKYYHL